jgi:hypothetical protein
MWDPARASQALLDVADREESRPARQALDWVA